MRLEAPDIDITGKKLECIALDLIGSGAGTMELWWVARVFTDGSTQPEGMYVDRSEAESHANALASQLGVSVAVTRFTEHVA